MKRFTLLLAMLLLAIPLTMNAQGPNPAVKTFKRGLKPLTPAQKQLRATGVWHKTGTDYPPQWSIVSPKNSMFLNDQDGDCVLAGECVNINAHWYLVTGQPVIISDAEVQAYGSKYNLLNGADLMQVIGLMSITNSDGLTYSSGTTTTMYCDGVGAAVNYQNRANVMSACYSCSGSLKMGVAADDLQRIGAGNGNGWYLGSATSNNIDHNVEMLGYGPASYCFQVLAKPVPAGIDPNQFCYLVNTWSSIGVVNAPVVESSGWCNEIDMRSPTSIAITPSPGPGPGPGPTPTRRMTALLAELPALVDKYNSGSEKDKATVLSTLDKIESTVKGTKQQLGLAP